MALLQITIVALLLVSVQCRTSPKARHAATFSELQDLLLADDFTVPKHSQRTLRSAAAALPMHFDANNRRIYTVDSARRLSESTDPILGYARRLDESNTPNLAYGRRLSESTDPVLGYARRLSESTDPILGYARRLSDSSTPSLAYGRRLSESTDPILGYARRLSESSTFNLGYGGRRLSESTTAGLGYASRHLLSFIELQEALQADDWSVTEDRINLSR